MRLSEVSNLVFYLYNFVLLIGFIWLIYKFRFSKVCIGIILLFFQGMFVDLLGTTGHNIYKVLIFVYIIYLFYIDKKNLLVLKRYKAPAICLLLYIIYYLFNSFVLHNDRFLLVFSQLSKYIIPLCFFYIFITQAKKCRLELINVLIRYLLLFQIFFCIAKLLIIGNLNSFVEGWVGSITGFSGGAAGTTLPILGLFWYALNTKMKLNKKGILFLIGLLIIGFATGKRAVWFLFPVFFLLLQILNNPVKKIFSKILIIIPFVLLFVYFGFRLTPSLNPENKLWGKFDLNYTLNYSMRYTTGNEELGSGRAEKGRVGAVTWMIDKMLYTDNDLFFGNGAEYVVAPTEGTYTDSDYYMGLGHRGEITGIVSEFMQRGFLGVLIFLIYIISLFNTFNYNRISVLLLMYILFDYIFYNSSTLGIMSLQVLMIYVLIYSFYGAKKRKSTIHYI